MSTQNQASYISDLAVKKTKEFKEVKELLIASGIVLGSAETVGNAQTIAEITHALTDQQASNFIDVLTNAEDPKRSAVYAPKRVERTVEALEGIKSTIAGWGFN